MAISRAQELKQLLPGLNALFGLEYKRYAEQHKEIYAIESSDRSFEEEVKLSGFGAADVKPEGSSIKYDDAQEAWTARWNHETIALGFAITEEAMEDNLYANLGARYTKALARSMAHTKQVKAASLLNRAFTGSGNPTYGDGQVLCSTAHPLVSGGTNSNRLAAGADLNETSLEASLIQISQWTDERGLLIATRGMKLIVPPQLQFVAERLMKSELRTETSDNDINAIRSMGMLPQGYSVNDYLTDPNAFFIMTDISNGMKMFNRVALNTKMDGDFDTGNVKYRARERYSFGVGDPLHVFGSPGSS